jgi:hypothetical protein
MKWKYLWAFPDSNGWLPCTVCRRDFPDPSIVNGDFMYIPTGLTQQQEEWIERIWDVDPYAEFVVCEACVCGHCGAVPGLTADLWLDNQVEHFKASLNGTPGSWPT